MSSKSVTTLKTIRCFDAEPFAVVLACLAWCVDERRVDGVAVTRHTVLVVPSLLVCAVDHNREFDGQLVTVEFRRQTVFDLTTPSLGEFVFDLRSPRNDWNDVGVVVCLHQRETLPVVEFAIDVDSFDFEVEVIDESKKLCEDNAGGVAVGETAHRQGVAFVLHASVQFAYVWNEVVPRLASFE